MSDDGILRLQFPALHLAQQQVMDDPHRFKVVACGRRFGKTTLGISAASRTALVGGSVAWCGPTYRMVVDAWEQFCHLLHPATARRNEAEHRLHLITGGMISCWSLDAPDTVRGSAYARIIIDEAAMVPHLDRVWQQILRPTLTDYRGDAWFLSTPRGLGYFHSLFQAGLVPQDGVGDGQGDGRAWASFSFPSSANPHLPTDDVDEARAQLSERDYAQEYLGQFLETDGSVFTNVLSCIVDALPQAWQPGHEYLLGVDWGRLQDATACVVLDITAEPKAVVAVDRFMKLDYHRQLARIKALGTRFSVGAVVAERNAVGDPLTEQLRRDLPVPVHPFTTTAVSKRQGLDRLILAFERQEIALLRDDALIHELLAYSARTLPSGLIQYGAPPGGHDDLVMALMLAWEGSRFVLTQEQWRAATSLSLVSGGILGDPPLVALLPGSQL